MTATKRITRKQLRRIVESQVREAIMLDDQGDIGSAADALIERIYDAIEQIEQDLMNGEFHRDSDRF